jgi:hypothetical protein
MPPRKKATSKRVTKEDANPARKPRTSAAKKVIEAGASTPAPAAPPKKAKAAAAPVSKSAEMLQRKRDAQRAKMDADGASGTQRGRGLAAAQGRGPSGRTRGPVKK